MTVTFLQSYLFLPSRKVLCYGDCPSVLVIWSGLFTQQLLIYTSNVACVPNTLCENTEPYNVIIWMSKIFQAFQLKKNKKNKKLRKINFWLLIYDLVLKVSQNWQKQCHQLEVTLDFKIDLLLIFEIQCQNNVSYFTNEVDLIYIQIPYFILINTSSSISIHYKRVLFY